MSNLYLAVVDSYIKFVIHKRKITAIIIIKLKINILDTRLFKTHLR